MIIFCFYGLVGVTGVFCILAIVSFCVWMSCAVAMALEAEKGHDTQPINTSSRERQETYFSFVKSLLYN